MDHRIGGCFNKMKYFTKQWYEESAKMSIDWGFQYFLKIDERANKFSEEFFQEIFSNQGPSDLRDSIEYWEENLPKNILDKVADMRLLAMYIVSQEIYDAIIAYCIENDKWQEEIAMRYQDEIKGMVFPEWVEERAFHDCPIESCRWERSNIIMRLGANRFTDACEIIFEEAEIIEQEVVSLEGTLWLYDEVYEKGGKYEVHIMLLVGDYINEGYRDKNELAYTTITASNLIYIRDLDSVNTMY